jgi:sulfotransferase
MILLLSGIPRSGSSLLSAILRQNPDIDARGRSGLLPLMWDINAAFDADAAPFLEASGKTGLREKTIKSLVNNYHDSGKRFSVDKSSFWTHPNNYDLINSFVNSENKIVVLLRNIEDIMMSWVKVYEDIIDDGSVEKWLMNQKLFIEIPLFSIDSAINSGYRDKLCFVHYEDLISNPEHELNRISDAWSIPRFPYNFNNIDTSSVEDDEPYLANIHNVRSKIEKNEYNIDLSSEAKKYCSDLQEIMDGFTLNKKIRIT